MISFILLFMGLILILLEFYLPGAVMGFLGGTAILFAILSFGQSHSLWATILFVASAIALIILLIRFAIWKIVSAKPDASIYLKSDQEGFRASSYDHQAIGKTGVVLSDLKPGGYILIDGVQHQAISTIGYIAKGTEIKVVSGQEESLIVIPKKES